MNRDSLIILILIAVLVLGVRWYASQNDSFLLITQQQASPTFSPTPRPTIRSTPTPTALPTPRPTAIPTAQVIPTAPRVLLDVPFISQAPFGDWADPRQQDGCEEAVVLTAMEWVRGMPLTAQKALDEMTQLSKFSESHYGTFHDTSIGDTYKFFHDFYGYSDVELSYDITAKNIKDALSAGSIVIVPMDGRLLQNPHYTLPGPMHHMIVIKGFDDGGKYFITNDPGTRYGESYRYNYDILEKAIRDYPTGSHEPQTSIRKGMIVVHRSS